MALRFQGKTSEGSNGYERIGVLNVGNTTEARTDFSGAHPRSCGLQTILRTSSDRAGKLEAETAWRTDPPRGCDRHLGRENL